MTKAALFAGTEQMRPGNHLGDVSAAIQRAVEVEGLSIIRTLVGHGIGREMHEDPQIPNFGEPGKGPLLEEGTVLAIEPMVNAGGPLVRDGGRRLGRLLPGRLAGRPLRVHGRGHRRRPADPHPLAREGLMSTPADQVFGPADQRDLDRGRRVRIRPAVAPRRGAGAGDRRRRGRGPARDPGLAAAGQAARPAGERRSAPARCSSSARSAGTARSGSARALAGRRPADHARGRARLRRRRPRQPRARRAGRDGRGAGRRGAADACPAWRKRAPGPSTSSSSTPTRPTRPTTSPGRWSAPVPAA